MDSTIDNTGDGASMDADADDGTISVSADAVSIDGTAPEVGDTVTFAVEGTVSSASGGTLMVTPTKINGQPVDDPTTPPPSEADSLRSQASAADADASM